MQDKPNVHLVLCYKNFAAFAGISHIGLGVAALNIAKILNKHGIKCTVLPILNSAALDAFLDKNPTVTHVEIAAPWIPTRELQAITYKYHNVQFAVNCHSNVGFLQADTNGVKLIWNWVLSISIFLEILPSSLRGFVKRIKRLARICRTCTISTTQFNRTSQFTMAVF